MVLLRCAAPLLTPVDTEFSDQRVEKRTGLFVVIVVKLDRDEAVSVALVDIADLHLALFPIMEPVDGIENFLLFFVIFIEKFEFFIPFLMGMDGGNSIENVGHFTLSFGN